MANLENNNENKNKKSASENLRTSVQKTVKETVKGASELATDALNHPVETAGEFVGQAARDVVSVRWWARLLQVIFWVALSLVIAFLIVVNLPATKNWAAQKVMSKLNEDLKSQIYFKSIDVNYFGDVTIHKVSVKDNRNYPFLKAEKLYADSNWFSIISDSRNLQFQSMSLDQLDLRVITYKGDSISNFIRFVDLFDNGKPSTHKEPFQLKSRIYITNSKVSIINQNTPGEAGKWLNADHLNLVVPELRVRGPEVFAQINNLSFITERWGKRHFVETFSTNLSLNKKFLQLEDLTLNTTHSLLQGNLKFNLNNGKWEDFSNKVSWDMTLAQGSQVSGYDISYFVTDWDNIKPINISGKMAGPLNKFYLENFLIHNPQVNIRTPMIRVQNILNGNFLIESNAVSTDFTYIDLKAMLPHFISDKMKNFADDFGRLKYDGAVRVTPKQVYVPSGNLITGIGQAKISRFYLNDYSTNLPKYSGYAEVSNLNTSVITKSKEVGLISGKFNLKGQSFDVNTMRVETTSQISSIVIMDKEINNVYLNGLLNHRTYKGIINVNDEQAKAEVTGFIDFSRPRIIADVAAQVDYLNLSYFTGQTEKQVFSGKIDGTVAMSNLNDMNMDISLGGVSFASGTQRYHVDMGKVKAYFENGNRVFSADLPGIVQGQIAGRYNIGDLPGMIQNGLGKILVGPPPRKLYRGQHFDADFRVQQGLVSYFMPELSVPQSITLNGSYKGDSNNLVLNVESPTVKYIMTKAAEISAADRALAAANPDYQLPDTSEKKVDSISIDQFLVRINTENTNEQIFARADRAKYGDNILKNLTLSGHNETGSRLHLATNFQLGSPQEEADDQMKEYSINVNQTTDAAGDYVFRFEPTELKFNNIAWNVDTSPELNHSITYRRKTGDFLVQNLRVYSENSELLVKDAVFKSAKSFQVDADVKNFQISKIFEMQASGNPNQIMGVANGSVNIRKDKENLIPLVDFTVDDIMMNGQALGDVVVTAKNSGAANIYDIEARVQSSGLLGTNSLLVTGTVNNNTASPTLDLNANLNDFNLAFTQSFVESVFAKVRGTATGDLKISGTLNDVDYSGDIALKGFGMKLIFTGVDYSFDDTVIPLSKGLAILNDIGVHDGRNNSKGSVSGAIQFETLASMGVNLVMRADNLMLLNIEQKDFDLFWGRVYGQGDVFVDGPVSALNISTPNMRALNNSVFTFNSNSTSNVEEFKMLRFLKEDNTGNISVEEKKKTGANMNLYFTVSVDKGTTVNVLVGDEIGDITVRGTSDKLRFVMARNGNIEMNGDFIVDNGTFISKAILQRKFQIAKGSSIRWDGDAMSPDLDINASYLKTVTNAGQYLTMSNLPPVSVVLTTKITQKLNNPKVELGVSANDVSSQVRDALAEKMSNEDEKVIQFGSVLVLSSFNVSTSNFDINLTNTLESSGYNMLFKQLGSVLNTISNEFQVDLDYLSGNEANNIGNRANASVSFALSPRITVKTGLGIPISKTENTERNYLSADGIIEYDWSKKNDGTRIFRAYSKPSNIGMTTGTQIGSAGDNQSYGMGVAYSKSFNTIFKRRRLGKKRSVPKQQVVKDSVKNDTVK